MNKSTSPCPKCKTGVRAYPGSPCKECRLKLQLVRRALRKQVRVDPGIPEIQVDPLKDAYDRFDARNAQRSAGAREKALVEENRQLQAERAEYLKIGQSPTVIVYNKAKWLRMDAVACAVASDWHVEEPVNAAHVHGLNEYDLEIARRRSEFFFKNLLKLTDTMARDQKITTIHLSLLGDFISGHIHEELMASTLLNPGDAANFVLGLLISGIDYLLKNSSYIIEGDAIPGNHGRMTDKVWIGDPTGTSLETFMYTALVGRFHDNPRVKIRVATQGMIYRQFFEKFRMRLLHGYEVKFGGGVGGLTIPLRKALAAWNNPIRADLTVLGHFHQFFDGGDFIVNGSLIGYNTFAQTIRASFEEARQAFFLVSARKGGQKSVVAPIWLDDAHKGPSERPK